MAPHGSLQLVRHATLLLTVGETTFLVDPMLSEAGANPPVQNTPNDRRNPLVDLPDGTSLDGADALLVTHRHQDHLDDPAVERFAGALPVVCQPADAEELGTEFDEVRTVDDAHVVGDAEVVRTPARHGHGELAERMGPVSGFLLRDEERSVYVAGDTVWYEGVAETLAEYDPDVVVVNAGAARFVEGDPITMTAEDVVAVCEHTDAPVVAVHMEAINHCLLTREDLRAAAEEAGVGDQVHVPADGERVAFE
ncbi:MBL fold metallo-hydrolase [Halomarina ordinaria]|uniref:MBL fold metallo-hydrolase n=1 Tax=Halomarina ordinaria TaxID=3033939 RepID=A0ABD5U7N1_9EURY|nr:MBL fold metallo-hydrolase [Halomarina sp. PSRA2]